MKIIQNENMPIGNGHYSMCIEHNNTLYIAGQLPMIKGEKTPPEGIEAQTKLVLEKLETIVVAAGSNKKNIIQVRIYLSDISLWGKVNEIYAEFFGDHKPVRAVVPVKELHYGCLIELEATAAS